MCILVRHDLLRRNYQPRPRTIVFAFPGNEAFHPGAVIALSKPCGRRSRRRSLPNQPLGKWRQRTPRPNPRTLRAIAASLTGRGAVAVSDRSITLAEFGEIYLGGRSAKTAKRRVIEDGIPHI